MAAAQDGDAVAYRRLLREVAQEVHLEAARLHFSASDSNTLTDGVLLAMHRVRHTYDPSRSFAHWLNAIVQSRLRQL